jgi:hypothetical protein
MTKRRFGKRSCFAAMVTVVLAVPAAQAQQQQADPAPAKAGKLINAGDVLSGELSAMKTRGGKRGTKVNTFQGSAISRPGPRRSSSLPTATPKRRS